MLFKKLFFIFNFLFLFPIFTGSIQDTELEKAVDQADVNAVKEALKKGANPNYEIIDEDGVMSIAGRAIGLTGMLYNGKINNDEAHLNKVRKGREIVKLLLKAGAKADWKDKTSFSLLHIAAKSMDEEVVKILIEKGAKQGIVHKDKKSDFNGSTIILCIFSGALPQNPERYKILELLLKNGGNKDLAIPDAQGRTPLRMASEQMDFKSVELLLNAGANPNQKVKGLLAKLALNAVEHGKAICTENLPESENYQFHCLPSWEEDYKKTKTLLLNAGAK